MRILFLGDMVGKPARKAVAKFIAEKKEELSIDLVIANSDNLAHGRSVTRRTVEEMLSAGVDILTCGDHAWDNAQALDILKAGDLDFVAPANLPGYDHGMSRKYFEKAGAKILVINLMGMVFIEKELTSPFEAADKILEENSQGEKARIILVDFHAETTSEKKALGRYLSGRVSAVLGTHTHVQTSDEEILPEGTAYLTDAGMVGARNSILGCEADPVIKQFTEGVPFKYRLKEDSEVSLEGVLLAIDEKTGKATGIDRVREIVVVEN